MSFQRSRSTRTVNRVVSPSTAVAPKAARPTVESGEIWLWLLVAAALAILVLLAVIFYARDDCEPVN